MEALEYRHMDKAAWPDGPWKDEPDKMQWPDDETGFPCLIVRNRVGALCGYVGVTRNHPAYGQDYFDMPVDIDVHGGLTFADKCRPGAEKTGICHIPGEGESDDVWWLGFDCAHSGDLCPKFNPPDEWPGDTYRDVTYVKAECARLAKQLAAIAA